MSNIGVQQSTLCYYLNNNNKTNKNVTDRFLLLILQLHLMNLHRTSRRYNLSQVALPVCLKSGYV